MKIGTSSPNIQGKVDFYLNLNLLNEKNVLRRPPRDQRDLSLCARKDDVEAKFAIRTKATPIGVAAYRLQPS